MRTLMKMSALFTILLLTAVSGFAQQSATADQPLYMLSGGLGFNHYDTPQFTGELSFAARVASGTYNVTTLKMTSKLSTMATGISKQFYSGGGFAMSGIVDGGLATGGGNVGGVVSGGGMLTYDLSALTKVPGAFCYGGVKVVQTSLGGVQPAFSFGFGKAF
jgi:hypothetical protein